MPLMQTDPIDCRGTGALDLLSPFMRSDPNYRPRSLPWFCIVFTVLCLVHSFASEAVAQGGVTVRGQGVSASPGTPRLRWGSRGYRRAAGNREAVRNFEVSLGAGYYAPDVGDLYFTGESVRRSTGEFVNLRSTGRSLGFVRPSVFEITVHARRGVGSYLAFGLAFGFIAGGGADRMPSDAMAATVVGRGWLWGLMFAPEINLMLPVGPVTFRIGGLWGVRGFSVGADDLERGTCTWRDSSGSTRSQHCHGTLDALTMFVQPRAQIDLQLGGGLVLGTYAAFEPYPASGYSAGLVLSFQTPGFGDRWAWAQPPSAPAVTQQTNN